jgi:hypothetical protein
MFIEAVTANKPLIVVDNTNNKLWEFGNYILLASAFDYEVEIHEFLIEKVDDLKRIAERSQHNVPFATVCRHVAYREPTEDLLDTLQKVKRVVQLRGVYGYFPKVTES